MRKPPVLTKGCPHRWCRPLHRVLTAEGAVLVVALSLHQLGYLAYLLALSVLVRSIVALVTRRTLADSAADDDRTVEPGDVRSRWANLAVSLDLAFAVISPFVIAAVLQAGHNTMLTDAVGHGPTATVVGTVVCCAPGALCLAAHYLATRPRRRKRVLVPATN
ncbi:hypothetical protein GCM10010441_45180 [Kitasatospora paracochleata]|uniref:Uncharacterized protein n=1 Tax=Kitasatospora paracochleata TaxID=58354 RepID=A0ABT1J9F3_9ACTN|nr:hypothetical protein [Kitasatospora paracochleata]MCP2314095.1 hypothetical protein [Kitasatospora paracochleata]